MGYGQNEHVVIRTDLPEITSQLAQNATLASSFKTILNTWDNAIQQAINSLSNGIVKLPNGQTITIETTITLKANVILDLNGCIVKPSGDFDCIHVVKDSQIKNGKFDTSGVNPYSSTALYVGGTEDFSVISDTIIDNLHFVGTTPTGTVAPGTAIKLHANPILNTDVGICFVQFGKILINGFNMGIWLRGENPPSGKQSYVNSNIFTGISLVNCINPIYLDINNSANNFTNVHIQPIPETIQQIYIDGLYNKIDVMPWDSAVASTNCVAKFTETSANNYLVSIYNHGDFRIVDLGRENQVVATQDIFDTKNKNLVVPTMTFSPPSNGFNRSFTGDQDDFLVFADKRYTVTTSINPSYSAISSLFNIDANKTVAWDNSAKPVSSNPLVITVNFNSNIQFVGTLGLTAKYGAFADYTKVEVYDSSTSQWVTVILKEKGVKPKKYPDYLIGYVDLTQISQMRITMYDFMPNQSSIELERIFLQIAQGGKAWLSTGGGKMFGDIDFSWWGGQGVVMADQTNGNKYRLIVNNGVLGIELV